ncbi:ferrous iron transport protein B [Butyrivibrio fibrisolvens]|uniref:Ferrous iron transport protein B n=1 Tax=Butyrivibrio fibrisolvens TaxID=831 RepID=A0A1H9WCC3_BUTFI|nr:ferrous iron transport protein B [Butyrivibrio fibrisolvens]SES31439.1 ferrous iron transport protein B [Butyrivibrio fibrisolvens]
MALKIALAGNPNCGKTTLFNALTGSNQYVGNWPGVTVEKKEGKLKGQKDVVVTDLPGIYSLSPYTLEEVVSRKYLLEETPDAIINMVDATNIERNLYLTTQVVELGIPVVIALNMMDVVRKNGDKIDSKKLSSELGVEVVEISALKSEGLDKLISKAVAAAKQGKAATPVRFDDNTEKAIAAADTILPQNACKSEQRRWFDIKLLEKDSKVLEKLTITDQSMKELDKVRTELETANDDDTESVITNARYEVITDVVKKSVSKANSGLSVSDKIDRIVTNRILALPIFALVMFIVYYVSVTSIGTIVTDWTNDVLFGDIIPPLVESGLDAVGVAGWLKSLILDGIVAGVGAVLGFVPQMLILFIFLAFLEYCGYMARVAFIMDRIFRKFGLSGKSFIPMLIASGCGVPGVMSSRTIDTEKDRRMTIMTTTFIPCGAKLPIIALIAGAFFGNSGWVAWSSYFIGIAAVIFTGIVLKKTKVFAGDPAPFVMELPAYHMPTVGSVLRSMWERGWSFIKKAGTVILLSTIVLWFLMNFGFTESGFGMLDFGDLEGEALIVAQEESILAKMGGFLAPIFAPLGFGTWQMTVAAVSGLIAKENVVATIGMLFGFAEVAEDGAEYWDIMQAHIVPIAAYAYLVFNLLCAPCFAAMGAIKREMNNGKWTMFAIGYQCVLAYVVGLIIYQIGGLIIGQVSFGIGTIVAAALVIGMVYLLVRPNPYKDAQIESRRAVSEN